MPDGLHAARERRMKLFWITTQDHDEDWFVVAASPHEATTFFETYEGYDTGDAQAEEIVCLPDHLKATTGFPPNELLHALGARFLTADRTRVVELAGRRFCEGLLEATICEIDDDRFEQLGEGRPNQTARTPES